MPLIKAQLFHFNRISGLQGLAALQELSFHQEDSRCSLLIAAQLLVMLAWYLACRTHCLPCSALSEWLLFLSTNSSITCKCSTLIHRHWSTRVAAWKSPISPTRTTAISLIPSPLPHLSPITQVHRRLSRQCCVVTCCRTRLTNGVCQLWLDRFLEISSCDLPPSTSPTPPANVIFLISNTSIANKRECSNYKIA